MQSPMIKNIRKSFEYYTNINAEDNSHKKGIFWLDLKHKSFHDVNGQFSKDFLGKYCVKLLLWACQHYLQGWLKLKFSINS